MAWLRNSLLLALILGLTGCGFHLRGGEGEFPAIMQAVLIDDSSGQRVLRRELEYQLQRQGVEVVSSRTGASMVLRLEHYRQSSRVVALDNTGYAREKELEAEVVFSVQDPQLNTVLSSRSLSRLSSVLVDKDNVAASERAELDAYLALQRQLATALVTRLRFELQGLGGPSREAGQQ